MGCGGMDGCFGGQVKNDACGIMYIVISKSCSWNPVVEYFTGKCHHVRCFYDRNFSRMNLMPKYEVGGKKNKRAYS
jgi:hypothetical protein